jgi:hypothetical protein
VSAANPIDFHVTQIVNLKKSQQVRPQPSYTLAVHEWYSDVRLSPQLSPLLLTGSEIGARLRV